MAQVLAEPAHLSGAHLSARLATHPSHAWQRGAGNQGGVAVLKSRRRRSRELGQVNLLELAPVRLATWKEVDGRVVIERPKPRGNWRAQLRYWLAVRRIRLDDRGSLAWLTLDGEKTVAELADVLRQEFGSHVEPAEERAGDLVRMLHQEDLLAYPGWDDVESDQEC